jgi:hypothetical protein
LVRAALLGVALSGCSHSAATPVRVGMQPMPPLSGRLKIATTIVPRSQRFKVAVLTFIDQTGRAQLVVDPIADMLTTELFGVRRFELYDRKDLVEQTHARASMESQQANQLAATQLAASQQAGNNQFAASQLAMTQMAADAEARARAAADAKTNTQFQGVAPMVDGVLLGYVTSFKLNETDVPAAVAPEPAAQPPSRRGARGVAAPPPAPPPVAPVPTSVTDGTGEFDCDFRIVNALATGLKELVVFSDSSKVRFRMKGGSIELDRSDVTRIASEVKKKFPDFTRQTIKITSLQDNMVSLNVGDQDGVKQGFTGYVVQKDEKTGVYRYLAEFVIINVFPSASTAIVLSPHEANESGAPESPDKDRALLADILANIKVGSEAVIK